MLTHLPLCSIPNPKKVLLVGGGDGGILREISRHTFVEQIDIYELDQMVIDVYKQFFPEIAIGYEDLRVNVNINQGVAFLKAVPEGTYDVIILDAFECMGATAIELANKEFLESVARPLHPRGVMSAPADSFWLDNFIVEDTIAECRQILKGSARYAWSTIPSFSWTIEFVLCSTVGLAVDFEKPINPLDTKNNGVAKGPPKFYNSQIHTTAFCLSSFAKKVGSAKF
ncbi:hypothetical protein EUGRSUZ_C00527 [Eucalyptus grandis]|uniref:Uncharacterized protein n=2 Tax=Eucalyptus grandis TaxID=71139 RepID=A0ACC3LA80_EUCGR|nr:hypothetical protein EUGRSUZ_C00527 [Eucalyptus grandis]